LPGLNLRKLPTYLRNSYKITLGKISENASCKKQLLVRLVHKQQLEQMTCRKRR